MKNIILILLALTIFSSCKRNHSGVLVKVYDNDTGQPIENAKVKVIRKGKEGLLITKKHLVVGEDYTNGSGQVMVNFKYDRGNPYCLNVFAPAGYFQTTTPDYFDLEPGKNEETVYLYQASYLKLNFKSLNPTEKFLRLVEIEDYTNTYVLSGMFYHNINPIDTTIFKMIPKGKGNKKIVWEVDSAGTPKSFSLPIELKGHDTTYVTLNF